MDVSNLAEIIRFPFELAKYIIDFFIKYLLEIIIVALSLYFIVWLFRSGVIQRLSDAIIQMKKKKVKGGKN